MLWEEKEIIHNDMELLTIRYSVQELERFVLKYSVYFIQVNA